ncbi:Rapid alkalinization factor [Thalictrum thalictroides]|uniref:Rapid alkalinization factor n=1 Tax=Thalictrum thalictroides TaxID=46969 RepID=A0A7J6WSE5_THATH|nr:Rapid alkalinization factor [Thalictrum thalictroides]
MATNLSSFLVIFIVFLISTLIISTVDAFGNHQLGWIPTSRSTCQGSIAECLTDNDEFDMDSEISRRILAATKPTISYPALDKNHVPCSRPGGAYYNCKQGAKANTYERPCTVINRCPEKL